jgi:hypothetical protein
MKKYISIIAVLFTVGISGCKKDYLSLETNPNTPSVTTPGFTLSAALNDAVTNLQTQYIQHDIWAGYLTASGNYTPNLAVDQYLFTGSTFDGNSAIFIAPGAWVNLYSNLTNLNNLQNLSSTSPANANFQAIAMIMKAYDFEMLVDEYNDVPYTQAFQPSTILFPAYDKAADIYHDLGKQLDAAIALINKNTGATNPAGADVLFQGNMTSWKKFANTIKLRLAIHVSTNTPSDPLVTDLSTTAGEGYLDETLSAGVNPGYSNSISTNGVIQQSPFYAFWGVNTTNNPSFFSPQYRANAFCVGMLKNFNDPRLLQFYAPVTGVPNTPTAMGNIFGNTTGTLQTNSLTSSIGPGIVQSPSQDAVLFSGAESLFLQAEAALKGFITGNAQTLYQRGITASFEQVQAGGSYVPAAAGFTPTTPGFIYTPPATTAVSDALATTYYSQNIANVGWAASTNKQQAIITQKYLALAILFPLEAYDEYWRTGFPNLPSSIDPGAISPTLPRRIYYPTSELTSNLANLQKEGTINPFTSKIFWTK